MASFRCYDNSDVIATLITTNFHLYLIQLWWQFFQMFVYGDIVYAQTWQVLDCKTVRIFAYSGKREQSNKRSGTRLKTESETGERRFFSLASHALWACEARALCARKTRTPRFTDFFTDFEKKTDCFAV